MDFDSNTIKSLSKSCSKNIDVIVFDVPNGISSENTVPGANIKMISVRRLVVDKNSVN